MTHMESAATFNALPRTFRAAATPQRGLSNEFTTQVEHVAALKSEDDVGTGALFTYLLTYTGGEWTT